ncbi:MAG: 2-amino-4-hydroxy-6-hydroxymethyldihydropteridine diphosphokinase [Candidatus Omnitrophica bacterium]|nr:2-amino-4-hydroxy-6-hydroxymethyldihydropteridine diphosphokinase [Candidatus Omnitrophota bacterium]
MNAHLVYCGAGSNLGDRGSYLRSGAEALAAHPAINFLRKSGVYETEPQYGRAVKISGGSRTQAYFLNTVWEFETFLSPHELLDLFLRVERNFGRNREDEQRWGPRTLDLDVLFYDDWVLEDERLVIPHPRLHERRFVLEPLSELAPNLLHPVLGSSVWTLLSSLGQAQTAL